VTAYFVGVLTGLVVALVLEYLYRHEEGR